MNQNPISVQRRPLWVRVVTIGCIAFTAWHVLATFLWVAPPSGLRDVVPKKALSSYMMPLFGQSWSVFAPAPVNGDYTLRVRAVVEGSSEATEWVDATAAESNMLRHHAFPPRAAILAGIQARDYKKTYDRLSADQKKAVAAGYFKGEDWLRRLDAGLTKAAASKSERLAARSHVDSEGTTTAYATQVARAVWGDAVTSVDFEVSRQNVVPFANRNDPNAQRPKAVRINSGWRGQRTVVGQHEGRFAEVFNRARIGE